MKSFWDERARQELLQRLAKLRPDNQRRWGKMSCEQILKHLNNAAQMVTGELPVKRMPSPLGIGRSTKQLFIGCPGHTALRLRQN